MTSISTPSVTDDAFAATGPSASLWTRILAAIADARSRQAQGRIAAYLASCSEERLADQGFTDADIASIRAGEPVSQVLARRSRPL